MKPRTGYHNGPRDKSPLSGNVTIAEKDPADENQAEIMKPSDIEQLQAKMNDALKENRRLQSQLFRDRNRIEQLQLEKKYLLEKLKLMAGKQSEINGSARDWHAGAMVVQWAVETLDGIEKLERAHRAKERARMEKMGVSFAEEIEAETEMERHVERIAATSGV